MDNFTYTLSNICACGIFVAFQGLIWWWNIYGSSLLVFCYFLMICAVMLGIYEDYSGSALRHVECGRCVCLWEYTNNIQFIYISVLFHTIDCSD